MIDLFSKEISKVYFFLHNSYHEVEWKMWSYKLKWLYNLKCNIIDTFFNREWSIWSVAKEKSMKEIYSGDIN